jgi:hypothetical protein
MILPEDNRSAEILCAKPCISAFFTRDYAWSNLEWNSYFVFGVTRNMHIRGADKSLARPTSQCILFDGENI